MQKKKPNSHTEYALPWTERSIPLLALLAVLVPNPWLSVLLFLATLWAIYYWFALVGKVLRPICDTTAAMHPAHAVYGRSRRGGTAAILSAISLLAITVLNLMADLEHLSGPHALFLAILLLVFYIGMGYSVVLLLLVRRTLHDFANRR